MGRAPRSTPSLWSYDLRRNPGGSFTAQARGLLAMEFTLLDPEGEEFGRLRLNGPSGAEFSSGEYTTTFEASKGRYRMVAEGEEILAAGTKGRSLDRLYIHRGDWTYEAWISLFRNLAVASDSSGERVVRLSGDLTGWSYHVRLTTEEGCALPVAVFLLWHLVTNRRRAYRARRGAA